MRSRLLASVTALMPLLCILSASYVQAGVTGKVFGVVIDAKTQEPIVGATVRILGTSFVTKSDADGEYFVINVPSGKYDLAVSNLGYETIIKKEVRVLVDLTTPVDFALSEEAIELSDRVVVVAETPVIQQDLTASKVIFTADRLRTLPNIITVQSVLTNYPGIVLDRNNELHVRGGRSGEVSYYFDGFSVQDPFVAQSGLHIIPNSLEELTLTSGGYTAEYGEALSGIVSAVSRAGGASYHGNVKMYEGFTQPYDINTGEWSNLKRVGSRAASFNFSGPMPWLDPDRYTFSMSGEYLHDPTDLPHNGRVLYTGTAKLSMQPISRMKLISNLTYYESNGQIYTHRDVNDVSYDLNLDGLPVFKEQSYLVGLLGNYHFTDNMILSAGYNRFYTYYKRAPHDLFDLYWNQWPGYAEDSLGNYIGTIDDYNYGNYVDWSDPAQVVGFTVGDDYQPIYRMRETKYDAFHVSLVNQIDKAHQIKTGIEHRQYTAGWDSKQFLNIKPYGEKYTIQPTYFSWYLQDKMEYDFYVINVGVRYDYRNADVSYTSYEVVDDETTEEIDKLSKPVSRISPRFGISFPVTEKSVMHVNYGVYYQIPVYTYMFMNMTGDVSSGYPLLGNPDLIPEQTTSYEIGLDHLLTPQLKFDITAYYKDIKNLVTTESPFSVGGNAVTWFVNNGYGSVKGFDISLEKLPSSGFLTGSISYTYMIAKGVGSYALDAYYNYITDGLAEQLPVNEYPLDFDQRHTFTAVLNYRVPFNEHVNVLGSSIPGGWGVTMVGHYGSGLPYTMTDVDGNRLGGLNEARLPAYHTVDMRFNKDVRLSKDKFTLGFFVEVDNIFNRRNVIDVYTLTGQPDADGITPHATLALSQEDLDYWDSLYDHDPQNYSPPRTIRTGLEFNF